MKTKHKNLIPLIAFFVFSSMMAGAQIPCLEIFNRRSGNIFFNDEDVQLEIKGTNFPQGTPILLKLKLTDFNNETVKDKSISLRPTEIKNKKFVKPISLASLPNGFYILKVVAETIDEKHLASTYVRLGVITRRPYTTEITRSPFAIDTALSWYCLTEEELENAARLIKLAGISCVRDRLSWNDVEPSPGKFYWEEYDRTANAFHNAGLEISQVFHDLPPWADTAPPGEKERRRYPPKDMKYLYDFMYSMVSHFKGRVQYWEIWNEYDSPTFFVGGAEQYARMLKTAYTAAKKADPSCRVLIGSRSFATGKVACPWVKQGYLIAEGEPYVERVFQHGVCEFFDIYNMHFYGPAEGVISFIERSKKLLNKYHCPRKPIWITEMGKTALAELPDIVAKEEQEQAAFIPKAYAVALNNGVERLFFFLFPAFTEHGKSNWGIFANTKKGWIPKPAYVAFANLTDRLKGYRPCGRLALPNSDVWAYKFRAQHKEVIIIWAHQEKIISLSLPAESARVIDIMGKAKIYPLQHPPNIKPKPAHCEVRLELNTIPVFVEFIPGESPADTQ